MIIPIQETGFDFDGVIADTAEAFIRLACSDYGYCNFGVEDITRFEVENCLPIPTDIVLRIFTDILNDSIATDLRPMPGAVEGITKLASATTFTIITARLLARPVYDWLDRFFPATVVTNIRVIATGDHGDKFRHIDAEGLRYFIDDRAETCKELMEKNISSYVYSQPWNINRHNLPTVADWSDIMNLLCPSGKSPLT